jgi:hypothetical protein
VRARVVMMENDRRLVFLISPKTSGKQMIVNHSELTAFYVQSSVLLRNVYFFGKNRRPFASKCFVREQLLLGLIHLGRPIRWTGVLFLVHMHRSKIRHLYRCYTQHLKHCDCSFETFPCTNRHEPLAARLSNYAGSNANKRFFIAK